MDIDDTHTGEFDDTFGDSVRGYVTKINLLIVYQLVCIAIVIPIFAKANVGLPYREQLQQRLRQITNFMIGMEIV